MKIVFDLRNTGLGNGGGSSTLVKSSNILYSLGHNIIVIDSGRNQHTWTKLNVEHRIIKSINDVPNSDIVISTGYKTVLQTVKLPERCGKKLIWMRGWELWQMSEENIIKKVLKSPLIKVVNSFCLIDKLKKYGVDSYLIRPGNNLNDFNNLNIRNKNKIVLGGLFNIKHKTKRSDLIIKIAQKLKLKYSNIELHMFGNHKNQNTSMIDKYISQPSIKEKNKFYNHIDIWLSTSILEGLHITPQEAMLCGCVVIGNNSELSGTKDYLIDNKTGLLCSNTKDDFIENIEKLIIDKNLREKLGKNGRNKIIELGDRKYNMEKFVKLMEKIK